jgi:polysaccharide pyruvyl transferase WcaK-like protein
MEKFEMINKVLLFGHGGSANHGCEAIVRSTQKILNRNNTILASGGKDQDLSYKLNDIVKVEDERIPVSKSNPAFILAYLKLKLLRDTLEIEKLAYIKTFKNVNENTLCLSIGGDNFCYPGWERYVMLNNMAKKRGAKTVLWSVSVEPKSITEKMANDFRNYDFVYARESITYEAIKKLNPNTFLFPDVAFQLDTSYLDLPKGFEENNTIGINVSPLIIRCEQRKGMTMKNYETLIQYIISSTDMQIALIPHVTSQEGDDRGPLSELYNKFKYTNRVVLISDHNCMELKGLISRCRMFIGARTHATIAAYSMCVPTLVVGYSVKAKGIAKDIFGTYKDYVIPVQGLKKDDNLLNAFRWMLDNEGIIRKHLQKVMPDYRARVFEVIREYKILIGEDKCRE